MPDDQEHQSYARWQRATLDMVQLPGLEALFQGATSAHASEIGDVLYDKLKALPEEAGERPLIEMLAAILRMHEMPANIPPFGPMVVMADGSRSAAPDDFAGTLVEVIVAFLERTKHPVVRARLAHLAWFLERSRRDIGLVALGAYINVIECLDRGQLQARGERGALSIIGRDLLRTAFSVCQGLGRPSVKHDQLKTMTADLLRRADREDDGVALRLFADLALHETAVPPEDVAGILESFIERIALVPSTGSDDFSAQMWLLVARAHKRAKDQNAAHIALRQASECYVARAETFVGKSHGAMLAAHWMETAIATLHGVPDTRERRQELRHRLVDIQGAIRDDLIPFSHETDISDLVNETRADFTGLSLYEALRRLTFIQEGSPDPEKLVEDARQSLAEHPLSSLFATSHMDAEGKTIARAPAGSFGAEDATPEMLEPKIMQAEAIRRGFTARSGIDVARSVIMMEHHVSEEVLLDLLRHSPSLPRNLVHTATRGFVRWFEGDMVAALYVLTPLLEGILRHLLKQHGHDVTTIDNATKTQEDRTITALYDALRPEMDAIFGHALTEDIRRTFLSKLGPSLRHGVAHALLSDGTPYGDDATYGCWLIWMITMWPLLPHWEKLAKAHE